MLEYRLTFVFFSMGLVGLPPVGARRFAWLEFSMPVALAMTMACRCSSAACSVPCASHALRASTDRMVTGRSFEFGDALRGPAPDATDGPVRLRDGMNAAVSGRRDRAVAPRRRRRAIGAEAARRTSTKSSVPRRSRHSARILAAFSDEPRPSRPGRRRRDEADAAARRRRDLERRTPTTSASCNEARGGGGARRRASVIFRIRRGGLICGGGTGGGVRRKSVVGDAGGARPTSR